MAHLLPPAGIDVVQKGDQFRFSQTFPGPDADCQWAGDIPLNIHDYKWTDYQIEDRLFRQQAERAAKEAAQHTRGTSQWFSPTSPALPTSLPYGSHGFPGGGHPGYGFNYQQQQAGRPCGSQSGANHHFGAGWGYCPPINVDPRSLIRPRNPGMPDSQRPSGKPYFAQDSQQSCLPAEAPLAKKGGFNFKDWLRTVDERRPPQGLREGLCLPSVCTICQPQYIHCCPGYADPRAYTLVKQQLPPHFGPRTSGQPVCCLQEPALTT